MDDTRGVVCLWGGLKSRPQCPHGNRHTCTNIYIEINFYIKKLYFFQEN